MYTNERFDSILGYLKKNHSASVEELANLLYVSKATVRRDLEHMQKLGVVARTHGGAMLVEHASEVSIFVRREKNAEYKAETVNIALKHLPDFTSVFIDNSSTCLTFPDRISFSHKTVVTNGIQIAGKINLQEHVKLYMPGGEIYYNTNSLSGEMACDGIKNFRFDLMLCSCAALDYQGSYEQTMETMAIKKAAFNCSKIRILLADKTKIGKMSTYKTVDLSAFDFVITNADDLTVNNFRMNGVKMFNR